MLLFILRHADAEPSSTNDFERALTTKGIEQARRVGRFCQEKELRPDLILTSPLVRARQTAQQFVSAFPEAPEPEVAEFLASGMDPETGSEELAAYNRFSTVMIVGHQPDLSRLIAHLLGLNDPSIVRVRKASLTLLAVHSWRRGGAELEFALPCKLM
ncbi:MAG: phosphohistidine phosphatase SixA [Verrucomicrobiota bacterium]